MANGPPGKALVATPKPRQPARRWPVDSFIGANEKGRESCMIRAPPRVAAPALVDPLVGAVAAQPHRGVGRAGGALLQCHSRLVPGGPLGIFWCERHDANGD